MCQVTDKIWFILSHRISTTPVVNTSSERYNKEYFILIACKCQLKRKKYILQLLQFCMENRSCFVCNHMISMPLISKSKSLFPTYLQCWAIPLVKQKGTSYQEAQNMLWKSPLSKLEAKALQGMCECQSSEWAHGRLQCCCCLCFLISSPSILFSTADLE